MSQQASFYYHIDTDGNYWFPLFPDAETASFVDGDLYGAATPGAHEHQFNGATWYMPNTMASAENVSLEAFTRNLWTRLPYKIWQMTELLI